MGSFTALSVRSLYGAAWYSDGLERIWKEALVA
jgi:hypothetical protein